MKLFKTHSEREIKRIEKLAQKVEDLEPTMQAKSDDELKDMTRQFRERLKQGETLDDLLPEAFATAREAGVRTLGLRAFHVQILGAIILHQGRIAEMFTGEGKTLTSSLAIYLNALDGLGVHVVTVNDYLAKRDAENMGHIYKFLGVTCGYILNSMDNDARREAYACDITYGTNNEFGFDYLRDNMVIYKEHMVQRSLHFAVIDEVDSCLIDEARTPLIISGQSGKSTKLYEMCDILARQLEKGTETEMSRMDTLMAAKMGGEGPQETGDFVVNEKEKTVNLTARGVEKVEQFFHIDNYADVENLEIQHNIILALRAHNLMFRDKDYVVKDNEVLIVDDFTGRILPGRRYSDGLHQAIEAKEHVKVKRESKTLVTITLQNYFNKYEKKCGMTGTAITEDKEFREIYGMDVVTIPPNKPVVRIDYEDAVYQTHAEKIEAILDAIEESHKKGQPVLVGTITIEASEEISYALKKRGIKHNVLNAKFHEMEAEIVAQAGRFGAVTIATNMAGRGTDIKLGGSNDVVLSEDDENAKPRRSAAEIAEEAEKVKAVGGLRIIGTERHEARRIDNQLRGRSGRQGDPGESRFFISLEDDLMRLFGSERMMNVFKSMGIERGQEIHHKLLSKAIERAQKKIENNNFGIRKNLMEYDQVNNEQREIIYAERRRVLDGENMRDTIIRMVQETVEKSVNACISDDQDPEEWDINSLNELLLPVIPMNPVTLTDNEKEHCKRNELTQRLKEEAVRLYESKEAEFPVKDEFREVERIILLRAIDTKWMNHIDDMDQLRQSIGLQAFAQRNPVDEYKLQGFDMFQEMIDGIEEDTVRMLLRVQVERKIEREQVAKETGTNKDDTVANAPVKRVAKKIMPNDPCPCGSGKKFKYCCKGNGKYD
ncbi:MAG: preprotein translocase subunit SecA [Lachnospiraceae bacterium]|nr:preprotein translocase subunit SecA [Lachnospiraceae bacterium]